ncbi:hypothetical protein pb186bvf_015469 [Paramecium bursaria]
MEEEVVNYRTFEELPHQYEHIDGDGWREKFKWIDNKRIMNKYEPQNLQLEWNILKEQCNNLRSNVQKNALLLVREIIQYDHLQYDNLESFSVLQLVFEKCNLEFKFLSQEALKTVEILSQKAYNRELIQILCQITNKCPVIQCYSYTTLVKIVCNSNLDCDWEPIIQSTLLVYDGKSVEQEFRIYLRHRDYMPQLRGLSQKPSSRKVLKTF